MKVGRSHHWIYDSGEWKETKITPDEWEVHYAVTKRRKGKAPEGSGVPVGTKYHWYILAHQRVEKLNANDYSTELYGFKFKIAHQRASNNQWNISTRAQKKRLVKILKKITVELESEISANSKHITSQGTVRKASKKSANIENYHKNLKKTAK